MLFPPPTPPRNVNHQHYNGMGWQSRSPKVQLEKCEREVGWEQAEGREGAWSLGDSSPLADCMRETLAKTFHAARVGLWPRLCAEMAEGTSAFWESWVLSRRLLSCRSFLTPKSRSRACPLCPWVTWVLGSSFVTVLFNMMIKWTFYIIVNWSI